MQTQKRRCESKYALACMQSSRQLIEKQTFPTMANEVLLRQDKTADRNHTVHSAFLKSGKLALQWVNSFAY